MEACALALQSEDLSKKERRRKEKRSQRRTLLGRPGPAGLAGGRRSQRIFFYNFRLSCGCVPDVLRVGFF